MNQGRVPLSPAQAPAYGTGNAEGAKQRAAQEVVNNQERAAKRAAGIYEPYRLWLPVGTQRDIVILDNTIDDLMIAYEHALQNTSTGKFDVHELCPKEFDSCPLCPPKDSYYAMFMSTIDWKAYVNKNNVNVPHSKKLTLAKSNGMQDFFHLFDIAMQQFGTIRGMHILLARNSQQDPAIGRPVMLPSTGSGFEMFSEETLIATFGGPAVMDQQGAKVIKPENGDIIPFQWGQIYSKPSGDDLRSRYGGQAPAGSAQANQAAWEAPAGTAQPAAAQPVGVQPGAAQPAAVQPAAAQTAIAAPVGTQPAVITAPAPAAQPVTGEPVPEGEHAAAAPPMTNTEATEQAPAAAQPAAAQPAAAQPAAAPATTGVRTRQRPAAQPAQGF